MMKGKVEKVEKEGKRRGKRRGKGRGKGREKKIKKVHRGFLCS